MNSFAIVDEGRTYKTKFLVASGTVASIGTGVPTIFNASGEAEVASSGEPTTSQRFTGMCSTPSTETASAAGVVFVYEPLPGIVYKGSSHSGNVGTAALINALKGKRVTLNLTSTVWTVYDDTADETTNGVVIVGGDYQSKTLQFIIMDKVTYIGS